MVLGPRRADNEGRRADHFTRRNNNNRVDVELAAKYSNELKQ